MFFLIAAVFAESVVEIINNDPTSSWVAIDYPPSVITRAKFIARLGAFVAPYTETTFVMPNSVPEEFDARVQWGPLILPVRDQASCGSCWAFSVSETIGDRMGIAGCGLGHMSPQDLVSCDTTNLACQGGYMDRAWNWVKNKGICTDECMPYTSGGGRVAACPRTCNNGSDIVRYPVVSWKLFSGAQMAEEIMTSGPLSVAFTVYSDFMNYKSGVYVHKTGGVAGGHAVICIGWGVQDGLPYWLCQNSWGGAWGEKGHFKILRGSNHCGIEATSIGPVVRC
jgi:cathepsin B